MATFWSTSRNELWIKGKTSGDYLEILEIRVNCEQNSILYMLDSKERELATRKILMALQGPGCYYRKLRMQGNWFLETQK